jgi:hypothetical protein
MRYFAQPHLWPMWPFLPLTRPAPEGSETQCGILYDAVGVSSRYGYSSTVILANLLSLPDREDELLALPRITYDTFDELADDGWAVD